MKPMVYDEKDTGEIPFSLDGLHLTSTLERLSAHVARHAEALKAMEGDIEPPGGDKTLIYHLWSLRRAGELAEETRKAINKIEESWEWHVAKVMETRGAEGTAALGRKITVSPDIRPGAPSESSEEYGALIEWLKGSQFAGIVAERFHWQSLKKVCSELLEAGQPPPPNVKINPYNKVKIT